MAIFQNVCFEGRQRSPGQGSSCIRSTSAVYQSALNQRQGAHLSEQALSDRYEQLDEDQAVSRQEYDEARPVACKLRLPGAGTDAPGLYTGKQAPIDGRLAASEISEGALSQ